MNLDYIKKGGLFLFIVGFVLLFLCTWLGAALILLGFIVLSSLAVFIFLSKAIKHTNWYNNNFLYTKQMCSNAGYRNYLVRNLDIVNVGSNPARFAFHYDDILGENWSTGNQGKDMDFEILKFRHSFIKKGGVVLLPIVPFSSVAGFLKKYKPEYLGVKYYAKFAHTLDFRQANKIPECREARKWIANPLQYNWRDVKYLFFDELPDIRLSISDMPLMYPQLVEDARRIMESWLKEFNLNSIHDDLSAELKYGFDNSVTIMQEMIDFLEERDLKPVIVLTPMSKPLQEMFPEDAKKRFIYDFIDTIDRPEVKFLDYSIVEELQDPQLYFNSLFLNLRGRKFFTKRVLNDLGLLK